MTLIPKIGEQIGGILTPCLTGDGKLISQMMNLDGISQMVDGVTSPADNMIATMDSYIGPSGLILPMTTKVTNLFKSYTIDQGLPSLASASTKATPLYYMNPTSDKNVANEMLAEVIVYTPQIKEIKYSAAECNPSYAKQKSSNSSAPTTDTCLILDGPGIADPWRKSLDNSGNPQCVACSATCYGYCLDDYLTQLDTLISSTPDKYKTAVTNIGTILKTELESSLNEYKLKIGDGVEKMQDVMNTVQTLANGSSCLFLRNTLDRVFISLCGHLKNSVGGFTAVMMGAAGSNLFAFIMITYFNIYLHNKVPKKVKAVKYEDSNEVLK